MKLNCHTLPIFIIYHLVLSSILLSGKIHVRNFDECSFSAFYFNVTKNASAKEKRRIFCQTHLAFLFLLFLLSLADFSSIHQVLVEDPLCSTLQYAGPVHLTLHVTESSKHKAGIWCWRRKHSSLSHIGLSKYLSFPHW